VRNVLDEGFHRSRSWRRHRRLVTLGRCFHRYRRAHSPLGTVPGSSCSLGCADQESPTERYFRCAACQVELNQFDTIRYPLTATYA
jgi:hypothetical protein